jgi:WD40 repeat protein
VRPLSSSGVLRDDHKALATTGDDAGEVQIWDLEQGRPGERLSCAKCAGAHSVAWGKDGRFLAFVGGASVDLYDLARKDDWRSENLLVEQWGWSPDGTAFAWANDNGLGEVLDVAARRKPVSFAFHRGEAAAIVRLFFNPDSKTIAVTESGHTLHLWETKSGKRRARLGIMTVADPVVAFSANGALLAFPVPRGLDVVDGHTGAKKVTLPVAAKDRPALAALAFSADGATLVSASSDRIDAWDVKAGKLRASLEKSSAARELVVGADGLQIAFGGGDEASWLWDVRGTTARPLGKCSGLAFTRDGVKVRCLAPDADKRPWTARVAAFDAKTGSPLPKDGNGLPGFDEPFVADPDGAAQLVRTSDGASLRFATVAVGDRRLPIVYGDDGRHSGERDAARKILFRTVAGTDEALTDAELSTLESKSLLADFLAGRPVAAR